MTVALIAAVSAVVAVCALLAAAEAWRNAEAARRHADAEIDRLDAVILEMAIQLDAAAKVAADARNTAVATAEFVDAALGLAGSDGADLMSPTPRPDASAN